MNKAYLLTGSNLGDRENYLYEASKKISDSCGAVKSKSSIYQTDAWGYQDQDAFLNQVLEVHTEFSAADLLKKILSIEETIGRKRSIKYGPRIIDIDILLFNHEIVKEEGLTIPHPQMQNRRFVLVPLNEIAENVIHPILKKSIQQLLTECADPLNVQKI